MRHILIGLAAVLTLGTAQANYCGELANGYGPYDYRKRDEFAQNFYLVESAHFTKEVESGVKGNTGAVGADIDYTLRAIPNHARALSTMANLGIKYKQLKLVGAKFPVECYFDRAIRFTPDDGAVRAVYANYQFALGKTEAALKLFSKAVDLSPEDPTINYNAGLAYFKVKDYEKANLHAQKAYSLGFPLPGLKNKLVSVGKWVEAPAQPKPAGETATEAPAAAPASAQK